jgi:hypothetical protein
MGGVRARNAFMTPMTEHDRQMLTKLCARISEERNPNVFTELVTELEVLLEKMSVQPPAQA